MDQAGTVLSLEHSRPKSRELNWDNGGGTRSPHSKNSIKASCGRLAYCLIDSCWKSPKQFIQQQWEKQNRTYGEVTEDTSSLLPQTAQRMLVVIHSSGPWEMRVAEGALSPTECNSYTYLLLHPKAPPQRQIPGPAPGGCLWHTVGVSLAWPTSVKNGHRPCCMHTRLQPLSSIGRGREGLVSAGACFTKATLGRHCFLTHLLAIGGSLLPVAANNPSYSL